MERKFKLLILVTIAITLFGATEVLAGEVPVVNQCNLVTDGGYNTWNESPYTFTFMGETPDPNNAGKYLWTYAISNNFPSPQNQLSILTPVCSPDIGAFPVGGGQAVPPGEGESTTGFGVYNFQDYVMRVSTSYPFVYQIQTDLATPLRNTSMQIKSGKILYLCPNIAGPSCPTPAYVPTSLYSEVKLADATICVEKDPATGCPQKVTDCDGYEFPLIPLTDVKIPQGSLKFAGGESDLRCRTFILYTESSPGCTYVSNGAGGGYWVCSCTSTTQCLNSNTNYGTRFTSCNLTKHLCR